MGIDWLTCGKNFFAHLWWVEANPTGHGDDFEREAIGEVVEVSHGADGDHEVTIRLLGETRHFTILASDLGAAEPVDLAEIEERSEGSEFRLPHPLPEDIREHLVTYHGFTWARVDKHRADSLLLLHNELHHDAQHKGTGFGHIHGLSAKEQEFFNKLATKQGWK